MLGRIVRVTVTDPVGCYDEKKNVKFSLNFGMAAEKPKAAEAYPALIMGLTVPVEEFIGKVVAILHIAKNAAARTLFGESVLIVSPKESRYIKSDIEQNIEFLFGGEPPKGAYSMECLYERSCGAVIFKPSVRGKRPEYLLIRNKRSAHWGFPKGHIERGETEEQTASREIFEETGLRVQFIPHFAAKSEYSIQGRTFKTVTIFLARCTGGSLSAQEEEIDDALFCGYDKAMSLLKFENDRSILKQANRFLAKLSYSVADSGKRQAEG